MFYQRSKLNVTCAAQVEYSLVCKANGFINYCRIVPIIYLIVCLAYRLFSIDATERQIVHKEIKRPKRYPIADRISWVTQSTVYFQRKWLASCTHKNTFVKTFINKFLNVSKCHESICIHQRKRKTRNVLPQGSR